MLAVTLLGSVPALALLVTLVAAWAFHRGARRIAVVLVAVSVTAQGLNSLLKLAFHRARPDVAWAAAVLRSYSFPSGHAMVSTAAYGAIALVVSRLEPGLRWPAWIGVSLLVLLIGLSRVYLGVHWPSDVIAGFAAGALLVLAGSLAAPATPRSG
jgi:undecaprenyl-diphosphatase